MTSRKEIFNAFALRNIFLPKEAIDNIMIDIKKRLENKESIFQILYSFETRSDFNHFDNPANGQYVYEPAEKVRRAIVMIDGGAEICFDSVYAAAKHLGLKKNCVGNIIKACNLNKTAYGKKYRWQ